MMEPTTYTVSEARDKLAEVIDRVTYTEQPAVITKHGKDKVALVPYRLLELITRIEAMMDLEKAQEALDDFNARGGMSLASFKRQLRLEEEASNVGGKSEVRRSLGTRRNARTTKA
ncbi:MAG: type II toxin-antitoxin system Phd/YefM family antitoxin [Rhizobiales bacterium]|nr:type II toxin-antitoxin system Phd/YefM family antitoxin [Hyphomicrobiales bacterium]